MPKTAFSTFFQGEFDVDQLLIRVGYPVAQDTDLTGLHHDLRQWIANDVVCPSCGVGGAVVVGRSRARGTGKAVSQAISGSCPTGLPVLTIRSATSTMSW